MKLSEDSNISIIYSQFNDNVTELVEEWLANATASRGAAVRPENMILPRNQHLGGCMPIVAMIGIWIVFRWLTRPAPRVEAQPVVLNINLNTSADLPVSAPAKEAVRGMSPEQQKDIQEQFQKLMRAA